MVGGVLKDKEKNPPGITFIPISAKFGGGGRTQVGGANPENITVILLGGKTLPRVFQSSVVSHLDLWQPTK